MEIRLEHDPDGVATAATRLAIEREGVDLSTGAAPTPWWRAGIEDAVERAPEPRPARYEAAPSPRSTRGATRA